MSDNQKLTSLKIEEDLFNDFKVESTKLKFSFQKLSEGAIDLYMKDEEFRKKVHNHKI